MSGLLVARVAALLERLGVPYALVGAGALAVHGVARSTFDLDLMATTATLLDPSLWAELADARVDIRRADADDPLAGVVRIQAEGQRDVDVVIGRLAWQAEAISRARRVRLVGTTIPVVTSADLVLLKLYAGGSQDAWDIEQLLGGASERAAIVEEVQMRLDRLPSSAARLWARIITRDSV